MTEAPPDPSTLLLGKRFEILGRAGGPAAAGVDARLARDLQRGDRVRVRMVERAMPDAARAALREEFLRRSRVRHGGIAGVRDYGVEPDSGTEWLAEDLLPERDLLQAADALEPAEWVRLVVRLLLALDHLHARGFVHGRLEPDAVRLLGSGRTVRAVLTPPAFAPPRPEEAVAAGTLHTFAPERLRGEAPAAAGDLYALGATLHQAMVGRPHLPARSVNDLLQALRTAEHSHVPRRADLPDRLTALVGSMLSREPERRPSSAHAAIRTLLGAKADELVRPRSLRGTALFAGRDDAMASLRRALARARRGRGGVVGLTGPAGVGKTRLLDEFALEARTHGAAILTAGADLDVSEDAPDIAAPGDVAAALLDGAAEPADLVDEERLRVLVIPAPGGRTRPWTADFLRALAEHLAGRPRAPLLACVEIPDGGEDPLAWAGDAEGAAGVVDLLPVEPVDREAALTIVRCMLPGGTADDAGLQWAVEQSGGVPLCLEESGLALRGTRGSGVVPETPGAVRRWALRRLQGVTGPARTLLRAMSLLERAATAEELAPAWSGHGRLMALDGGDARETPDGDPVEQTRAVLQRLVRSGLVASEKGDDGVVRWRPASGAVADSLGVSRHVGLLAGMLAEGLDELDPVPTGTAAAERARLHLRSGASDAAFRHAVRAARDSVRGGTRDEVQELHRLVLDLAEVEDTAPEEERREVRFEFTERLADMSRREGSLREAARHFVRLLGADPDPRDAARLCRKLGDILDAQGDAAGAERSYREGLQRLGDLPAVEAAGVHASLARLARRRGDVEAATERTAAGMEAMDRAEEADLDPADVALGRCELLTVLSTVHLVAGASEPAEQVLERLREIAREFDFEGYQAVAENNLSLLWMKAGDLERALGGFLSARRLFDEMGSSRQVSGVDLNIGTIHQEHGDLERADELFRRCEAAFESHQDESGRAQALLSRASVQLQRGRTGAVLDHLREAERAFEAAGDAAGRLRLLPLAARARVQAGRMEEAVRLLETALEEGEDAAGPSVLLPIRAALGEVLRAAGLGRAARAELEETLGAAEEVGETEVVDDVLPLLTEVLLEDRDPAAARDLFERRTDQTRRRRPAQCLLAEARLLLSEVLNPPGVAPPDSPPADMVEAAEEVMERALDAAMSRRLPDLELRAATALAACRAATHRERAAARGMLSALERLRGLEGEVAPEDRAGFWAHRDRAALLRRAEDLAVTADPEA